MLSDAQKKRYARQLVLKDLGEAGQSRLLAARVGIVGVGALGTVSANALARAGVGYLRLIDRDYVEESNLQRQLLYTEADAAEGLPKAQAAAARLKEINSTISIEAVVSDFNAGNAERLLAGLDLVVDGSDNFELRFLLNDVCRKLGLPWVYGGALQDYGVSLNIRPDRGPCLRCLLREPPMAGSQPTCASAGVLGSITGVIGNIQAAEAIKLLCGSPQARTSYLSLSLWDFSCQEVTLERDPDCPLCSRQQFDFLNAPRTTHALSLCGRDEVQVTPPEGAVVDFDAIAGKLAALGEVRVTPFMLTFTSPERQIRLFRDGRAIITKVRDLESAKSVYAEYVGL